MSGFTLNRGMRFERACSVEGASFVAEMPTAGSEAMIQMSSPKNASRPARVLSGRDGIDDVVDRAAGTE